MTSPVVESMYLTDEAVIDMVENTVVWRRCQDHSIRRGRSIFGLGGFRAMKE